MFVSLNIHVMIARASKQWDSKLSEIHWQNVLGAQVREKIETMSFWETLNLRIVY